jgi:hypothetical protein
LAVIAAGWWTYKRFIEGRPSIARAKIDAAVVVLEEHAGVTFLRANVSVKNTGPVRIKLSEVSVELQRIRPLPAKLVEHITDSMKPPISQRQFHWTPAALDVGFHIVRHVLPTAEDKEPIDIEREQVEHLGFDFCIGDEIERFILYAFFRNETKKSFFGSKKRAPGWTSETCWEFVRVNGRKRAIRLDDDAEDTPSEKE